MIVVDAGAFVEVLLGSSAGRRVRALLADRDVAVPCLFDAEVLHVLTAAGKHGQLTSDQVDARVALLATAPFTRVDQAPLLPAARRHAAALSGYDALYVALAEELDGTLVTTDACLARTAGEQAGLAVTTVTPGFG